MLAMGRCLMGEPELIMFDEPSLGLAPAMVHTVLKAVMDLNTRGIEPAFWSSRTWLYRSA